MRSGKHEGKVREEIRKRREHRREYRKDRIENDLERYGGDILESEEIREAFSQRHHKITTVGEHSIRVAVTSLIICYVLNKLNIKVSFKAVVIGALCHDLGMLGRNYKYHSNKESIREHPKDSVVIARKLVDELPEKTEAIIERHMWPAGDSKAPNSLEGVIVSTADKYNAVKDFVKGKDEYNTITENCIRDEEEKIRKAAARRKEDAADRSALTQ